MDFLAIKRCARGDTCPRIHLTAEQYAASRDKKKKKGEAKGSVASTVCLHWEVYWEVGDGSVSGSRSSRAPSSNIPRGYSGVNVCVPIMPKTGNGKRGWKRKTFRSIPAWTFKAWRPKWKSFRGGVIVCGEWRSFRTL